MTFVKIAVLPVQRGEVGEQGIRDLVAAAAVSARSRYTVFHNTMAAVTIARIRTHYDSQKMTVATMPMNEKKVWADRS